MAQAILVQANWFQPRKTQLKVSHCTMAMHQYHGLGGDDVDSPRSHRVRSLANTLDLEAEQLRGLPLSNLLAGGGKIFANQGAAARNNPTATYALSKPVSRINFFLSHAWATERVSKYMALIFNFNSIQAVGVLAVLMLGLFSFELFFLNTL